MDKVNCVHLNERVTGYSMALGRLAIFAFAILIVALQSMAIAEEQGDRTPALLADNVSYDADQDALVATGNVEIFFEDQVLRAKKVTYFNETGKIEAIGPLTLHTQDGETLIADTADMDKGLRSGLVYGARLVLAQNFQFASQQVERLNDRYSVLSNTVASTCQVCPGNPTPLWLVRARRIIRDNEEKQIHFEDVRFEFAGVTLAVLPYFRLPDPSVKRATGFLRPELRSADTYGTGIKLPYFVVINDHSDVTVTPFVTTKGTIILEGHYRQRFAKGDLSFDGAFALDERNTEDGVRGFFNADGDFAAFDDYRLNFQFRRTGDKDFLNEFGYSGTDRLTSNVTLSRQRPNEFVSYSATGYQSLRASENNVNIPFVAPEISYESFEDDAFYGGRFSTEASIVGLTRKLGRDVYKMGGEARWQRAQTLPFGLRGQALGGISALGYSVNDDPAFPDKPRSYLASTASVELRWPLIRTPPEATQVIEPVAQLVYRDVVGKDATLPNEDSAQIEFDASNLFALDRSPGTDLVEKGMRLNLGLNYTHLSNEGWNYGFTLGRVYRNRILTQFADSTGLNGKSSNFVAAANVAFPPYFNLSNQTLFNDNLSFSRNDIQASASYKDFDVSANYVYLLPDVTANSFIKRHEITLEADYKLDENWSISGSFRRNIATGKEVSRDLKLTYGNECITTDFSLSRRFTISNNIPPSTELGFSISLVGFGGNEQARPAHKCR